MAKRRKPGTGRGVWLVERWLMRKFERGLMTREQAHAVLGLPFDPVNDTLTEAYMRRGVDIIAGLP